MDDAADLVYGSSNKGSVGRRKRMSSRSMSRTPRPAGLFFWMALGAATLVLAQSNPTNSRSARDATSMTAPVAELPVTRQAYTNDRHFLVKLLSVPGTIPLQQYFTVRLVVFDGDDPRRRLSDAQVAVAAGMAHGMAAGFAHEMQSAPKVETHDGVVTVSGLFFHMPGDWTMQVTVHQGGEEGTASFQLACCKG
jgi:hypothetical protein